MLEKLQRVLERPSIASDDRTPIMWSDQKKDTLKRTTNHELPVHTPVDVPLASILLRCSEGDFAEAERKLLAYLVENLALLHADNEVFISFLNAAFVVQRLDLVAALLQDRYGFEKPLTISVAQNGHGVGVVRWDILPSGDGSEHRFTFDARAYARDDTRNEILVFQWEFPLLAHYASQVGQEHGSVLINRHDVGLIPGLAYCDSRPNFFLVPDSVFVPTRGYQHMREAFRNNDVRWVDRKPVAFWRGGTTGIPGRANDWSSLPRSRLCELARSHEQTGLFDVGYTSVVQFQDAKAVEGEIRNAGLMLGFVKAEEWNRYKFHIDIDGNSNSWGGLFQKLLTGSPVLKVESLRGLVQWYYDELRPWHNYVPVAPDMSDLVDKVKWLNQNDRWQRRSAAAGGNWLIVLPTRGR
jgi:Glycosyl transferase family 90